MNGAEISKAFFFEWGLPFIEREFPTMRERIAVGCFGGSQALGHDDHLSRDHGWGPRFNIYLDEDYEVSDKEVVERICAAAPSDFNGYRCRGGGDRAVYLKRTEQFFKNLFLGDIPQCDSDWLCCLRKPDLFESDLYFLRHGPLFYDGSGRFSQLRSQAARYPEDVWLLRTADCAWQIAHYGEYNFCARLVERGDPIPMQIALGHFAEAVMRMYFYLDKDFTPYWKWLTAEFRKRAYSPIVEAKLSRLPQLQPSEQAQEVMEICGVLKERIIDMGVVPPNLDNPWKIGWFWIFRNELVRRIVDPGCRKVQDLVDA